MRANPGNLMTENAVLSAPRSAAERIDAMLRLAMHRPVKAAIAVEDEHDDAMTVIAAGVVARRGWL